MQNFDTRIRPALIAEHKGMTESDAALLKRKWEVIGASRIDKLLYSSSLSTISPIAKLASTPRPLVM